MKGYKKCYHHCAPGEYGAANSFFVACEYREESGYVTITGLEYNKQDGYAYFNFDDFAVTLNPQDKESLMTYLAQSVAKGFSSAWYDDLNEIREEFADDRLLKYLIDQMPAEMKSDGVPMTCANCYHSFRGTVLHDALGWHGVCPQCGSSFDVDAIDVDATSRNVRVEVEEKNDGTVECTLCHHSIECDENGDMPELCPGCGSHLAYSSFEPSLPDSSPIWEEGETFYVTFKIDARYIAEVKAKDAQEALQKAQSAYLDADFGAAEDIDGKPIIVENEHGDFVWEKQ